MQDVSGETRKTKNSLICNQQVAGSNPIASSRKSNGLREIVAPSFLFGYSPEKKRLKHSVTKEQKQHGHLLFSEEPGETREPS